MSTIRYAGLSDVGRVRTDNEDHWFADARQGLFLVADGIGGAVAGGLASQVVAEVLPRLLRLRLGDSADLADPATAEQVTAALAELSDQLRQQSRATPGLKGMGSTVVLALIRDRQVLVAHMGDSRAYLLHAGRLKQLTKDHTLAQVLVDRGDISAEQAATHAARGHLTRFVGMANEALPEAKVVALARGDQVLLCSDGLSNMLSDQRIQNILSRQLPAQEGCRELIDAANESGGQDNITAVLVAVENTK